MNPSLAKRGQLALGLALLALGLGLLASRLTGFDFDVWQRLWPLIVIGFGVVRLYDARTAERRRNGMLITMVGLWLLVNTLDLFRLDFEESWPLLLVLLGVGKVLMPSREGRAGGLFLILIGVWLQISVLGLYGLEFEESWPLAIIIAGIYIIFRALSAERARSGKEVSGDVEE